MAASRSDSLSFVDINPWMSIYQPAATNDDTINTSCPFGTILLLPWMSASRKAILRYASVYHDLFPEAKIIIMTNWPTDFMRYSVKQKLQRLKPAIAHIQGELNGVLTHVFSNGGLSIFRLLSKGYSAETGVLIPIKALILDSAPGLTTFKAGYRAFSQSLPSAFYLRLPALLGVVAFATAITVGTTIGPSIDPLNKNWDFLHDEQRLDASIPRLYIYSEGDGIIDWRDVEKHADEARRKGREVVTQKIKDSEHVGHMRKDPDTYWSAVKGICKL